MAATLLVAEANWTDSRARPTLDDAEVRRRLAPWPRLQEKPWAALEGGCRSLNVRVGDIVARLPLDDSDASRLVLRKEAALLHAVAGHVPVPRLLEEAPNGAGYLTAFINWRELTDDESTGRVVGACLAALQGAIAFEHAGMFDATLRVKERFSSALAGLRAWAEGCLGRHAENRMGARRAQQVRALWDEHESEMDTAPVLCHADFKPWNVKWDLDADGPMVFDWEFAWAGPALFDIGMMLRWGTSSEFEQGLACGYEEAGGTLSENWRRLADLFDLFNMVGFLDSENERPRCHKDVLARIDKTLNA